MPVIATVAETSALTCTDQLSVTPLVTNVEGRPSPGRTQTVRINQGESRRFNWTFRGQTGNPVNLTDCGFESSSSSSSSSGPSIKLRLLEALSQGTCTQPTEVTGSIVEATSGQVTAKLPANIYTVPGVYIAEWGAFDSAGDLLFSNQGYLIVDRGLFGTPPVLGPPTVQEIRTHLRDNGPEDNYLLEAIEWDLTELAHCLIRPVSYWNEARPPIHIYNTHNYPYRHNWLNGTTAYLLRHSVPSYLRNRLAYSTAAGVSIDDKNKAAEYEQLGTLRWNEFTHWVQLTKAGLNMQSCFGSVNTGAW